MISISIDVPDLAEGVRFYTSAFGFTKSAEPYPGVAVLRRDDSAAFCSDPFGHGFCLLEREP